MRDRYLSKYMETSDKRVNGRGSPPAASRGEDADTDDAQEETTRKPGSVRIEYNYEPRPSIAKSDPERRRSLSQTPPGFLPSRLRIVNEQLYKEFGCLRGQLDATFLDTDLKGLVDNYREIQAGTIKKLPFSHLWYLFSPGQEVVTRFEETWQAYRVLQVLGGRKSLVPGEGEKSKDRTISQLEIECFSMDFDGHMQCTAEDGTVIESLADYLTERGKKYFALMSNMVSHRRYGGLSLLDGVQFETVEEASALSDRTGVFEIESDIIIDPTLAYRTVNPPSLGGGVISSPETEASEEIEAVEGGVSFILDDSAFIRQKWTDLLPALVYGYVLFCWKWYLLHIDLIEPVPTVQADESDGFERLVLPSGHRDIMRALVKTHAHKAGAAKRKGFIILLHGAPGVGKTSTAKCVAANAGRPLFAITCGDLGGETAQEVEANLERFFELARKWNCVLLLDEADVFLCTRTAGNMKQNSLVSVFLRVLKYYSGILVLTTNRVGSFDEAVKSRVHCALYYPPLDEDQTFKVRQMNINTLEKQNEALANPAARVHFSRLDIEDYAREHWKTGKRANRWNDRQIKNAFQSAIALAEWDTLKYTDGVENPRGPLLETGHFKTVAGASRHFDQYLEKVRRAEYIRVKETNLRDDKITNHLSDPDVGGYYAAQSRSTWPKQSSKSAKGKPTGKGKSKTRQKAPEPSSDESSSSSESESESSSDEGETSEEEKEEEEEVVPVPKPPKKKSGKKEKKKKDRD
ncbi:P-loop containing nucleoside triphosphate hydrolase protein [Podospora appendiculata]|uniref:P-loop containing nucleoside triphosphate hydrolase protein n=1 Tax=Podospora appendiculata TaxID=314037 RepID=A0AAE1CEF1_9PEZI|nr:P-loop containing nucleoside triphosphate hydrolase protein [Podospora appendiculata]